MMIELCKHYITSGFADFRPICMERHHASKECYAKCDCPDYKPSPEGYYPTKEDKCPSLINTENS